MNWQTVCLILAILMIISLIADGWINGVSDPVTFSQAMRIGWFLFFTIMILHYERKEK